MSTTPNWNLGQYRPLIRLLARGLLRDWPQLRPRLDHSDLANEVLLKAHQGLAQFRGSTEESLLTWLRVILANTFTTVCRRELNQARDPALERSINESLTRSSVRLTAFLEASQSSPSEIVQKRETTFALAAALETLPGEEAEAVIAYYLEGRPYREIADQLGVSAATVVTRVRNGLEKLQTRLGGHNSGDPS